MTAETSEPRERPARPRRRVGLWVLLSTALLALAAFVGFASLIGRPLDAPDWVKARIETQIGNSLDGLDLRFGALRVMLEDGWRPRVQLRDIVLSDPVTATSLELSNIDGMLALAPLLQRKLSPKTLRVSGVFVTVNRSAEGQLAIRLGNMGSNLGGGADFATLVNRVDEALAGDALGNLASVEIDALTLRYDDARAGRGWTVDGGRLRADRDGDRLAISADFALLGGRDHAATIEVNATRAIGSDLTRFGVVFDDMAAEDIASQSPALAWLGVLRAPISGALRTRLDGNGALGRLNGTLQIGAGVLQPSDDVPPVPFRAVRSYFSFDPGAQALRFDELAVESDWVSARIEGKAYLRGMESGWPSELLAQLRLTEMTANPADYYPEPVKIDAAMADFRLRLAPFEVTLGQMVIEDQGEKLHLTGRLSAGETDWSLALDGQMGGVALERALALWPGDAAPGARRFVDENIHQAEMKDIRFSLRSAPQSRPDLYLGFRFENTDFTFIKTLPPMRGASGTGELLDGRFVAVADGGRVQAGDLGAMEVAGTAFIIPDTSIKQPPARLRLAAEGPVRAALHLLDQPPFEFLKKAGQPVDLAEGYGRVRGTIDLRLKPKIPRGDLGFDLTGQLEDVQSDKLIPGKRLTAPALDLELSDAGLVISGAGQIGAVPVSGAWTLPFDPETGKSRDSQASGDIELSQRFLNEFNIVLPAGSYAGTGSGRITVDLVRGQPPAFEMTSDLRGVTLQLAPLGWRKDAGAEGALRVRGTLGAVPAIDQLAIEGGGLTALGAVALKPGGGLDRALFSKVTLASWLDAGVELRGRDGAPIEIAVNGGRLDMRRAPQIAGAGAGAGGAGSMATGPVTARLDRVQISDGIALTDMTGEFTTTGGVRGQFAGRVNGGATVVGQVEPDGGRSSFRISSQDAGGVFQAAGILENARGGAMLLKLKPHGAPGIYNGQLLVRDTRLRRAPAMAELLNAISIVGLIDQMNGEGIAFSEVDARFQLSPERVTLAQSSAIGPSMGISMDGYYFFESGKLRMQGVLSPVYILNVVGRIFAPRKGEGLIGFNYELRGQAANPRVSVNPLSVLTPGMFREIFRRAPPDISR